MPRLIVLTIACAATPAAADELGAAFLGIDARLEPDPLGGVTTDLGFGLEGVVTRWHPFCAGLRVGFDPDSDGEGTSAVRSIEIPVLARGGWCAGGPRAVFFAWAGAGITFAAVTTEVAGVTRTDWAPIALFGAGADILVRLGSLAALAGLGAERSGDRWAGVLRVGFGSWGP